MCRTLKSFKLLEIPTHAIRFSISPLVLDLNLFENSQPSKLLIFLACSGNK
eukprot:UN00422